MKYECARGTGRDSLSCCVLREYHETEDETDGSAPYLEIIQLQISTPSPSVQSSLTTDL